MSNKLRQRKSTQMDRIRNQSKRHAEAVEQLFVTQLRIVRVLAAAYYGADLPQELLQSALEEANKAAAENPEVTFLEIKTKLEALVAEFKDAEVAVAADADIVPVSE